MKRVVVVTGGTQVDLDDMRTLTNKSSGKFGIRIANAYAAEGCLVTVIHSESANERWLDDDRIDDYRSFRTYDDLSKMLFELREENFDIIVMAAAVSDYAFDKVDGKVDSSDESLTVTLKKTPKILAHMREWYQEFRPFIVGFKLLSGVEPDTLRSVSMNQLKKCRINMTLANDWQELRDNEGTHPCYFVTPEGGFIRKDGTSQEVANALVNFTLMRQDVIWSKSVKLPGAPESESLSEREDAYDLLRFAQEFGLLDSTDGNVTYRINNTDFWATPRQVLKNEVGRNDFIYARADISKAETYYYGEVKPSIDCSVHGVLYDMIPELGCVLHFHGGYVIPDVTTGFPFPCGTREEAEVILNDVVQNDGAYSYHTMVELVDHGYVMLLPKQENYNLWNRMEEVLTGLEEHWTEVGEVERLERAEVSPIFVGVNIAGIVARADGWHSIYLLPGWRSNGYGKVIGNMLASENLTVAVHDDCKAIEFYTKLGYAELRREGRLTIMTKGE